MPKFRWAYIGSGRIAAATAGEILRGEHSVATVYSRRLESAQALAGKTGAQACGSFASAVDRPDVDGVYVATPHTAHIEYARRAMELGKPVLCEKPVGITASDAELLFRTAGERGVYCAEAMWTWFGDVARTVKRWVAGGEIGEATRAELVFALPGLFGSRPARLLDPGRAGGALLDIGIYPVAYCCHLFGAPDQVRCRGKLVNGVDVSEEIELQYGRLVCRLTVSFRFWRERCVITGTEGTIRVPGFFHHASRAVLAGRNGRKTFRGRTDYLTEFDRAAGEIRAGRLRSEYVPPETTVQCIAVLDECRRQLGLVYPFERG